MSLTHTQAPRAAPGRPPWPILFMDSALACRRPPPASNASSSKKKDTLAALSRKYRSVLLACGGAGALRRAWTSWFVLK